MKLMEIICQDIDKMLTGFQVHANIIGKESKTKWMK